MAIAFLVFLAASFLFGACEVTVEATQPPSELTDADNALKQAFAAVLEAEQAGANVTGLINRLSDAANLLAQAERAYRVGDVSEGLDKIASVFAIASEVETEAVKASDFASISAQTSVLVAVISVIVGFYFVLLMSLVWGWFKRYHIKRLLKSKPEVKTSEA